MIKKLTHVTIMVRDQDEALDWYTQKLGFRRVHGERNTIAGFRRLTIAPAGQESPEIVLLKAQGQTAVGQGRMRVLEADDCRKSYEELHAHGVTFRSAPEDAAWGVSAVFEAFCGNPFNPSSRGRGDDDRSRNGRGMCTDAGWGPASTRAGDGRTIRAREEEAARPRRT